MPDPSRAQQIKTIVTLLETLSGLPTVTVEGGSMRAVFQLGPVDAAREEPPPAASRATPREPVNGCGADILRVLREVGCRLTLRRLLDEFADREIPWSESSVNRHLAMLREAGLVNNDPEARPPGYGISPGIHDDDSR